MSIYEHVIHLNLLTRRIRGRQ